MFCVYFVACFMFVLLYVFYSYSCPKDLLEEQQRGIPEIAFVWDDGRFRHSVQYCELQDELCNFDPQLFAWHDQKFRRFEKKNGNNMVKVFKKSMANKLNHFKNFFTISVIDK